MSFVQPSKQVEVLGVGVGVGVVLPLCRPVGLVSPWTVRRPIAPGARRVSVWMFSCDEVFLGFDPGTSVRYEPILSPTRGEGCSQSSGLVREQFGVCREWDKESKEVFSVSGDGVPVPYVTSTTGSS